MGTRISKNIGFFIPIEQIPPSLLQQIEDICDDEDSLSSSFRSLLFSLTPEQESLFCGTLANKPLTFFYGYNHFKLIYNLDDIIGLFICTPFQYTLSRFDEAPESYIVPFGCPLQTKINYLPYYDNEAPNNIVVTSDIDYFISFFQILNLPTELLNHGSFSTICSWG